jgi:hypothetical protein
MKNPPGSEPVLSPAVETGSQVIPSNPIQGIRIDIEYPADLPEYMKPAYLGCLHWACGNHEILKAFERASGMTKPPAAGTLLELLIDDAAGVWDSYFQQFIPWFNQHVWGNITARQTDDQS